MTISLRYVQPVSKDEVMNNEHIFVVLFNFVDLIVPQVAQLHHELNLKDELLQFYTNAAEESGSGSPT